VQPLSRQGEVERRRSRTRHRDPTKRCPRFAVLTPRPQRSPHSHAGTIPPCRRPPISYIRQTPRCGQFALSAWHLHNLIPLLLTVAWPLFRFAVSWLSDWSPRNVIPLLDRGQKSRSQFVSVGLILLVIQLAGRTRRVLNVLLAP